MNLTELNLASTCSSQSFYGDNKTIARRCKSSMKAA
jgi:hypothetical protein